MSLRDRIKAFLRDDDLHTKLDVVLTHVDRCSAQIAGLDAKKAAEAREPAKARRRSWTEIRAELESGGMESKG